MNVGEAIKVALDSVIAGVKVVESILGAVDRKAAEDLAEARERLEGVRDRIAALPVRAADYERRADQRRDEIDGEG